MNPLLFFQIDDHHFALPISCVDRVLRAMEITTIEGAPASLLGMINVHGSVIPVIDIRKRLSLPGKGLDLTDQLIIIKTAMLRIAFLADQIEDVLNPDAEQVAPLDTLVSQTHPFVESLIKREGRLIKLYAFSKVFALDEMEIDPVALGIQQ